ncbi:hypothetical protein F4808DRAFT_430607 [Astrocystis sublimbata]|nr:hypothetical protein F4808DRAFT_430607 [Astrocystis sublimbata]
MSTTAPSLGAAASETTNWQSKVYKTVVTPINFVTFLLSLYFIDTRNRARRYHQHETNERRPWLHRLLYQRLSSPYDRIEKHQRRSSPPSVTTTRGLETSTRNADDAATQPTTDAWYYRTKQKKLLKLEAADAFALRDSIIFAMCFLLVSAGWLLWQILGMVNRLASQWV